MKQSMQILTITNIMILVSAIVFFTIELIIQQRYEWIPIDTSSPILYVLRDLAFVLMPSLLVMRGVYFLRIEGFNKRYIIEFLIGIFIFLASVFISYTIIKKTSHQLIQPFSKDINLSSDIRLQKMAASNAYWYDGIIVETSNGKYVPTERDIELRQCIVETEMNKNRIRQGMYTTIVIALFSILIGILLSFRKNSRRNTRNE